MIDFRYHLVSLVSVFLALAVGIVLGAGPLKGTIGDTLSSQVDQLRAEKATLRSELDTAQTGVENRDTFTRAVVPSLVGGRLGGQSVLVVTLPGADADAVEPLTEALQSAGARVAGRVDVKDAWTDPAKATDRDAVLKALVPSAPGASAGVGAGAAQAAQASPSPNGTAAGVGGVGAGAGAAGGPAAAGATPVPSVSGATNAGTALTALLARAVVTNDASQAGRTDAEATRLLDGLKKGGLVGVSDLTRRANEVVVLAPGVEPVPAGQAATPSASAVGDPLAQWTSLAVGLDARSDGLVVAGPASSATTGGIVESLRAQGTPTSTVSTVDTGGTPMGDVATVLALREQSLGGAGAYGFVGKVKAPLPVLTEVKP